MLKSEDINALRIDYFQRTEFLCAKIAKIPNLCNTLFFNKLCFAQFLNATKKTAIHIERFNRSI